MAAYKTDVDVSGRTTYGPYLKAGVVNPAQGSGADVILGFVPDKILLRNRSSETTIFVSFNGLGNDDIELPPQPDALSAQEVTTHNRYVWVRSGTEAHVNPVKLLLEATQDA